MEKKLNICTLRVFEAFAGYGSQSMALQRLKEDYPGFDYEVVGISEIDKHAITAYAAVHGAHIRNYGDISKINWAEVPDFDLFTYSFPCQDISAAGLQRGFTEGAGTRSSLLWECAKAIDAKRPKYLLMENVKALTQKKFRPDFLKWVSWLESRGYRNFHQVLNAKDYGVPQNRERVFMVSILDPDAVYKFPSPFPLEKFAKDILEDNVNESYFLSNEQIQRINEHCERKVAEGCGFRPQYVEAESKYTPTLTAKYGQRETDPRLVSKSHAEGDPTSTKTSNNESGVFFKGKFVNNGAGLYLSTSVAFFRGGLDGVSRALKATSNDAGVVYDCRVRKFTPRECFRLMDVKDEDINKIQQAGISRAQQYKLAGNSIVVNCLYLVLRNLFIDGFKKVSVPKKYNPAPPVSAEQDQNAFSPGLQKKVNFAIKLLRSIPQDDGPIEISYSGGKDSDVILELAKMAGIPYRAIYKNTSVDPPGTIAHCKAQGVEILAPKMRFFELVAKRGMPSMFVRHCCSVLKEYHVLDRAVQGIRRCESVKRAKRYQEPEFCRTYSKNVKARIYLPILEWTDDDVVEFIGKRGIKCHPLYYDESGEFHVERRVGCIACPLASQRKRREQLQTYPKFLRLLIKAKQKYIDSRPESATTELNRGNAYNALYWDLFCKTREEFIAKLEGVDGPPLDAKAFLEDYFKVDLTI